VLYFIVFFTCNDQGFEMYVSNLEEIQ